MPSGLGLLSLQESRDSQLPPPGPPPREVTACGGHSAAWTRAPVSTGPCGHPDLRLQAAEL